MNDTERLAALLHEYRIGCLEDLPGDPVAPGDDERTHRKDAGRLERAGVRLSPDGDLRAALERLEDDIDQLDEAPIKLPRARLGDHDYGLGDPSFVYRQHAVEAVQRFRAALEAAAPAPRPRRPALRGPAGRRGSGAAVVNSEADFLAEPCYCGHARADHRVSVNTGRCRICSDGHYFRKPEYRERDLREAAARADPNHRHERTHTAYACPGFVPFQVCDDCGQRVPLR